MALSYEQAAFLAELGDEQDAALARARTAVEKAEGELLRPVVLANAALESYAGELVEKSGGGLSKAQAVAAALRTPRGERLYADYLAATDDVARAAELTERLHGQRDARRWATLQLAERVAKAGELGEEFEDTIRRELSDPEVAAAVGVSRIATVEKGDQAWREIEEAAERLVAKSDGLSPAQAIERVLEERPALYSRYLAEVGLA